ncbi:hypothetical protein [Lentzea flava]|uniref:Secreted protein n=1 Tax=Lentzea flava TaxID=103732 RepID=A0ABQ2V4S3_9PSEU|nr:hypothetical protein [Lentzea flava]MCP2202791.1 hypothetical protein [Lentzea flava]GGU63530.1 hypothetical protein GCM10010178_64490 [Lentzea flava]
MIKKTLLATAVIGGAMLVAASPALAGDEGRDGHGISIADNLCAAPWQWNGPFSLLHEGHAPGYAACNDNHAAGGSDISIANNACLLPWQWNGPLEVFTVDHAPSYVACNGNSAG